MTGHIKDALNEVESGMHNTFLGVGGGWNIGGHQKSSAAQFSNCN